MNSFITLPDSPLFMKKPKDSTPATPKNKLLRSDFLKQVAGFIRNSPIGAHYYELIDDIPCIQRC
jgi:hypothetical protein